MPIAPDIPDTEAAIITVTNEFRLQNKLGPVTPNAQLTAAARAYARVLGGVKDLPHLLNGTTPATRAAKAGYSYCQIGENLASALDTRGFTAERYAKLAVEGWEHSTGHRKNMLLPYVTETGVAVERAGPNEPRYIAVQLFARPRTMKIEFKIRNTTAAAVPYVLAGQSQSAEAHGTITLTACMPREIVFSTDVRTGAKGRYETRDGQLYTIKPAPGGGVVVELTERQSSAESIDLPLAAPPP